MRILQELRVSTVGRSELSELRNTQSHICSFVTCISTGYSSSMKPHQNPSSFSSLQQLLEELEKLITLESSRNNNPWIDIARLSEIFTEKYGVLLEDVAQSYGNSLRSLFRGSRRFSIYGTQIPQEFYVALLPEVVFGYNQNSTKPIQYRVKRPWKADRSLIRMLKAEGAEEISFQPSQGISGYQPVLIPEIKSAADLGIVLIEIIKSLTANHPEQFSTVAALSQKFRDYYGQPIRTVVRSVCPDIKLIDLLQTMPNLHVQEVDHEWQITLRVDFLE